MARMKVLLTEDVPNLGFAGDVQTVASGYARNYLLPRGEAIPATAGALKQAEEIKASARRQRAQELENAQDQSEMIDGKKLVFQVRAGENGRLYGSVTSLDVADRLEEEVGFEVDRRRILLDAAIRDLGIYEIELRFMPEVSANFSVAVVREEETWDDAVRRKQEQEAAARVAEEEEAAERMAAEARESEDGESEDGDEEEE